MRACFAVRILLVSQMFPGPTAPEFGVFVAGIASELEREHEFAYAVLDRPGGSRAKYPRLLAEALRKARGFRPDVVYAHFSSRRRDRAAAARAAGAGLVVTAHGRTSATSETRDPPRRRAWRCGGPRVVAVSGYLRRELLASCRSSRERVNVIDCGVDLDRFRGS